MKLSEAIDRLEVGETLWAKVIVNAINFEGEYIRIDTTKMATYLDGNAEIALAEPTALDTLAQEYDVEPETIREWLDRGHKGSFEKVEVPEKVEARLAEHWNEDVGNVLWWNFPVEEPPYCGTPLDEHFPNYKTHFSMIDMPTEIEKPKRWVVKYLRHRCYYYFVEWANTDTFDPIGGPDLDYLKVAEFTDRKKAEAVATLIDGEVEEV